MIERIEMSSDAGRTWMVVTRGMLDAAVGSKLPVNWTVRSTSDTGHVRTCPLFDIIKMGMAEWEMWAHGLFCSPAARGMSPYVELEPRISDEELPSFKFGSNVKQKVSSERQRLLDWQMVGLGKPGPMYLQSCPACGNVGPVPTNWQSMICWRCEHEFDLPVTLAKEEIKSGRIIRFTEHETVWQSKPLEKAKDGESPFVELEPQEDRLKQIIDDVKAMEKTQLGRQYIAAMATGMQPWTPEPEDTPVVSPKSSPVNDQGCEHLRNQVTPHFRFMTNEIFFGCYDCRRTWTSRDWGATWIERFFDENGKEIEPAKQETWHDRPPLL